MTRPDVSTRFVSLRSLNDRGFRSLRGRFVSLRSLNDRGRRSLSEERSAAPTRSLSEERSDETKRVDPSDRRGR